MSDIVKVDGVAEAVQQYAKERAGAVPALGAGFEGMGPLKVSNLVLVQRTSKQGTPGTFRDTMSGQEFNTMTVAILAKQRNRVLFPEGELGADPLCKSYDGLVPVDALTLGHPPVSERCGHLVNGRFQATCPQASWANYDRKTKTGTKPACKEQARVLLVDKGTGLPFRLTLNGMNLKPLNILLDVMQRDAVLAGQQGDIRNLYDYFFTMTPQKIDGKKGTFYVVNFSPPQCVKAEDRGKFGFLYEQYVKNAEALNAEVTEAEETEQELEY